MATPTEKSRAMNEAISAIFGKDREATIRADLCMGCGLPAKKFRNELSRREYEISGLCQKCQDEVFC